jgi:hypothetical protein
LDYSFDSSSDFNLGQALFIGSVPIKRSTSLISHRQQMIYGIVVSNNSARGIVAGGRLLFAGGLKGRQSPLYCTLVVGRRSITFGRIVPDALGNLSEAQAGLAKIVDLLIPKLTLRSGGLWAWSPAGIKFIG